jgi:DUF4097 and DUF4098 domain-containing protein YvlB
MNIGHLKLMPVKLMPVKLMLVLCVSTPLLAFAGEAVDKKWDVKADVRVSVENIAGEIEIQGWGRNEVQLTGRLGDSVDELEINKTDSGLDISVINRDQRNIDETQLILRVPESAVIVASAVSADIEISAMNSEKLSASSVSGDVVIHATSEWVSMESVSGDVEFSGQTERISAESVSGDVELSGVSGRIEATTVSGDMILNAGMMDSGMFETVSGDIELVSELSGSGKLRAESMSGDVSITLPGTQSGLFKAQSFSGRISSHFGTVSSAEHGPGSHLKYVAGDGGAEIRVESFSGNIKLKSD